MASETSRKKNKRNSSLANLKNLGHELLSSRAHINNLPVLLTFVNPDSPPQYILESLLSLQSFFTPLLPELPPSSASSSLSHSQTDPEFVYRVWVRSKFDDLVKSLMDIAVSSRSEDALREVVLDALMEFVKVGNGGKFHSAIYHSLICRTVHSALAVDDILLELIITKYFKYIDVSYFTYISLEKLTRDVETKDDRTATKDVNIEGQPDISMELIVQKIYHMLSHIPPFEGRDEKSKHEMWNGLGIFIKKGNTNGQSEHLKPDAKSSNVEHSDDKVLSPVNIAKKMKLKFTKAWISFLRLPLPLDVYKEVLVNLHCDVIPYLSNPVMLCDFLTRSYDVGGVVSVMALSSLYVLMTEHGLEYPNFYVKLYALLEPTIFMAKHRAKFFQLLDSCLKSSLLPAYLAAAFTKKLSRLALSVPPAGALNIIALIHNLLRRHPSINCLVHQDNDDGSSKDMSREETNDVEGSENSNASKDVSSNNRGIDLFDDEQNDLVKTNAMRSFLWEIDTLRHHYCPPVSRFVSSLESDLTVRAKTIEVAIKDFSSGSYATIFNEEIRRRVKQVPLAFYKATPTSLFVEADFPGWSFKCKDVKNGVVDTLEDHIPAKRLRVECL